MPPKPRVGMSLGQYLSPAIQAAELSYRQLAALSGVSLGAIQRLVNDQVKEPVPDHLVRLAEALDVRASDLFILAHLPVPKDAPSVDVALRAEYNLSDEALAEAKRQIAAIAERDKAKRPAQQAD